MDWLRNSTVLVLGLGASGLAMARWCARLGANVRVWDTRAVADSLPANAAALAEHVPGVTWFKGALTDDAFAGVKLVLRSPGLSPLDERLAAPVNRAAAAGIAVQGELDLFARALADLKAERGYAPAVLAVTGTNGKTTTTAMTAQLVARAGRRVAVAGNIGPTMLQTLADALDAADAELPEVWVLELSSFQLDAVTAFEPSAAALLNLTQDHLDWHGSMDAYAAAKARIFGREAVLVINRDDPAVEALVPAPEVVKTKGRKPVTVARRVVRFGTGAPQFPGDFGVVDENGMAWLVRAMEPEDAPLRGHAAAPSEPLVLQRLMPADALRVRGRHNAANALAALALAGAIGCALAPLLHGLREYTGEPHRVQYLATLDGVDAFDDSKGTNVGATVAALNGLGADKAPAKLVVILGGDAKGQDFSPLADPVRRHARAIATIGRDAEPIERALAAAGVPLQRHATLPAATRWCFEQARSGDAVLLSPACASLDMFRDYAHRAEVFAAEVRAIAADRGGVAA
ncbi:MAG TPA: UDP-N-acetylmuramoyl-L-alanine--D-glutamate ligase [Burkholderiaceae bacterium]|nr:UDP-N-acetylmuramoyl-L-alanine--D-glutamate ligase [Burkholderiaceae bacterium]